MLRLNHYILGFLLLAVAAVAPAQAGIIIGGTRVVYPEGQREVTVRLENKGEQPALVQAWLDDGDEDSRPDEAVVPFTLTPPIFRMEPDKRQMLRLTHTQEPMATDKETLYWLNVLEVPPKPSADIQNHLQFAFRNRIKVFYRPKNLSYPVDDAPSKLTWKVLPGKSGHEVEVSNPTPYYVSFTKVEVQAGAAAYPQQERPGGMVAPGQSTRFAMKGLAEKPGQAAKVTFTVVNDYGALVPYEARLTP